MRRLLASSVRRSRSRSSPDQGSPRSTASRDRLRRLLQRDSERLWSLRPARSATPQATTRAARSSLTKTWSSWRSYDVRLHRVRCSSWWELAHPVEEAACSEPVEELRVVGGPVDLVVVARQVEVPAKNKRPASQQRLERLEGPIEVRAHGGADGSVETHRHERECARQLGPAAMRQPRCSGGQRQLSGHSLLDVDRRPPRRSA
jgi:hypothetical protein